MTKRIKKDSFYDQQSTQQEKSSNEIEFTMNNRYFSNSILEHPNDSKKDHPIKLNRKERKQAKNQEKYEQLLLECPYPSLVEFEDIGCVNPILHNKNKAIPGSIPVPSFWKHKKLQYQPREFHNPFFDEKIQKSRDGFFIFEKNLTKKEIKQQELYPKMSTEFEIDRKTMKRLLKKKPKEIIKDFWESQKGYKNNDFPQFKR
ncbi:Splicing factor 3b, subunit 2 [Pseudoloma neurophilia]|uniref:Splicing factor 3b, subunit 2 n=1 Tax=Pseudoloma neurophilia TaxID=146866 RepID=A0A0R0M0M9_9MICR|nr:Splicing factor 3b, subunit 2 [Pseudoloma neurophilia]